MDTESVDEGVKLTECSQVGEETIFDPLFPTVPRVEDEEDAIDALLLGGG